jgi:cytochrome oxidase Cu insertion factor (SCO1/SenC/PrrC family)
VSASAPLPVLATVPEFLLVDETGAPFAGSRLPAGIWVGANFMFTSCAATCPRQSTLQRLQREKQYVPNEVHPQNHYDRHPQIPS